MNKLFIVAPIAAVASGQANQQAVAAEKGDSSHPNIVIMITDQQRADLCSRENFPADLTPFADMMANEGIWFNHAYTPCPASGPARVSLLTGRFPRVTHADSNHNIEDAVFVFGIAECSVNSVYTFYHTHHVVVHILACIYAAQELIIAREFMRKVLLGIVCHDLALIDDDYPVADSLHF